MKRLAILPLALLLAAPAAAQDQPQADPPPAESFDLAKEKVAECAGEKFVFAWGAGAHPTKVTLCSNKGADTGEIIRMISEAAGKIESATSIPEDRRNAIVQQMRSKIAELAAAVPAAAGEPSAPAAEVAAAPEAGTPTPPAPVAVPMPNVATAPAASAPPAAKPQLSFRCISPEYPGGGPCVTLSRDTILAVKSAESLSPGVSLRFLRGGEDRGEIVLGSMRKGQTLRFTLPRSVCSGIVTGELEMAVVRGGRSVDRQGPFLIRC